MRILILLFLLIVNSFALELVKVSEYKFKPAENPDNALLSALSIVITDAGTVIIADYKDYSLKVYRDGKLVQKYGSKGVGPGEFCCPDRLVTTGNRLVVYDYKSRRIIQLKLTKDGLIDESSFDSTYNFSFDIDLNKKGNIIVGGIFSKSRDEYVLKNMTTNTIMVEYGDLLGDFYKNNSEGSTVCISCWNDTVYLTWQHNLSTLSQYDVKNEELRKIFKHSKHYVPSYPNKRLETKEVQVAERNWRSKKSRELLYDVRRGTCQVSFLYSGAKHLYVICFKHPLKADKVKRNVMLVFNHSGEMVGDMLLPSCDIDSYQTTVYRRKTDRFHIFTMTEKEDDTEISCAVMKLK